MPKSETTYIIILLIKGYLHLASKIDWGLEKGVLTETITNNEITKDICELFPNLYFLT